MFINKSALLHTVTKPKNLFKFVKVGGPRKGVNEPP